MTNRFADPRVGDLSEATAKLRALRRILRDQCCKGWDAVGLPRLLLGTLLLFAVLLGIGREVVWTHPAWMLPAALVVAAFFYYPLAPTAAGLALVFIVNMAWFG